ncbi:hypothetical protein [Dyadobacter sediminis]|nr:hypothetical protein [Dyadobacter sediminis]
MLKLESAAKVNLFAEQLSKASVGGLAMLSRNSQWRFAAGD